MKKYKYKVEINHIETYAVDVLAKNEDEAEKLAQKKWNRANNAGTLHYFETEDARIQTGNVYDVTGTDDSFNP